jgi:L-lactate dehydrogenase complex protein LldG
MNPNFDLFKTRAEAVSAEVHRFPRKVEAIDFLCRFIRAETPAGGSVLWADSPWLRGLDPQQLRGQAPGLRFAVNREAAAAAHIGISEMEWGVANTGTLVQDATAVEKRLVSTLPLIHVALLATGQIVADLPSLFARISPARSNYISFITGPSRTADIERVLTIGVHGPQRLVIVCVDDDEPEAAS